MHGGLICLALRLSVTRPKVLEKSHISETAGPMVPKFGHNMDVDGPNVDLGGQGRRSKVKVTRLKNVILDLIL